MTRMNADVGAEVWPTEYTEYAEDTEETEEGAETGFEQKETKGTETGMVIRTGIHRG